MVDNLFLMLGIGGIYALVFWIVRNELAAKRTMAAGARVRAGEGRPKLAGGPAAQSR